MKVILQKKGGDVSVFEEGTLPKPTPTGGDLLIRNLAVSVNPVDYKVRSGGFVNTYPLVLGWDGAGVVEEVGENVKNYRVGDEVMYSGSLVRPGSNAQYTLVDERIVGKKPKSLSFSEAAGLPLTALTAWEALVEQLSIPLPEAKTAKNPKTLLIINGAGGVGSLATQIASKVLNLTNVITTASRPETIEWCKKMGATHVLNHHHDLKQQLTELNLSVDYIFICYSTEKYLPIAQDIIKPFGRIVTIVEVEKPLPFSDMTKSLSFSWEFMFAKSMYNHDMLSQSVILNRIADLVDAGILQTTVTETLEFSVDGLTAAHRKVENGKVIGKITLDMAHWA
ncbi:zinc-binding alcohol dehydrogenase family protein [Basidiobolus meristosporus CBS 931.73]|uniref:Zinc-binding alcohol dehydrogenase family protein n=1 Tax=Basidiobolus meristosporus CBS 931.73 TaxID=1314790 RepID=A0A1Y1WWI4_9FUNG|nr:zinc-binding alcohol dehydrogenase family protein [Basidiobolus meristosporus CBS 931.73]|eukprot:ORX77919.1 zinc-binding alcohol dehydrogenase family protein [Basidiobolus meristosporus CBS 931.73]